MTNKYYIGHRLSEFAMGKVVNAIILDNKFWEDCLLMVKIVAPIIKLLRVVDADEKPSLCYVYEGMFRVRKGIMSISKDKQRLYDPYIKIIDKRWDKHLRSNIHAATYFLNPTFLYDESTFTETPEIMQGLLDLLQQKSICSNREIKIYRY